MASLSGPVTGGDRGWAFGGPTIDLAEVGYRQDEFFLHGDAQRYRLNGGSDLAWDGRWVVSLADRVPFATRMVVLRPEEPAAFNGTVVVLWNNVSAGYENFGGGDTPEVFRGGFAYVAVSAQRVGVHGDGAEPQGLRTWDPARYGSLSIASDDDSYDIFTQAAGLVAPDRPRDGVDPMGGLHVRRLIAQGASQSAARLATYVNAIQPLTLRFDAFFLVMYFGGGTPLQVGEAVMTVQAAATDPGRPQIPEGLNLLRGDLGIPVMVANTECEATSYYAVRQPDSGSHRYWEVAGASHVSAPAMASSSLRLERDLGFSVPLGDLMESVNHVTITPVVDAALHHLQTWMVDGTPPPVQPRIEFGGDPPAIIRDASGIARGGIRLPDVDVPVAHNSATQRNPDLFSRLIGFHERFTADEVRARYGSRRAYLDRVERSVRAAEAAGVVLPEDMATVVAAATDRCPL
jgi:Alpha/beta hydrolase domain